VFGWAVHEARQNASRRERETSRLPVKPDMAAGFMRMAGEAANTWEAAQRADAERQARYRVADLMESNGVPPRYAGACLHELDDVPVEVRGDYGRACDDLKSLIVRGGIVALLGRRGAGKTWMACALVNAFCKLARQGVYAKAGDYFLRIDEAIAARASVLKVEATFLRPELLVLDAMEERADTPHKDRMLSRLIDKRYDAKRSTVLISNETAEKFKERVGETVADRIRDDGQLIACEWKSLRGRIIPAA